MKYWITTDTHLGHYNIIKYCNRPVNHEDLIIKNITNNVTKDDILIHLGDVACYNVDYWNRLLTSIPAKRRWLIKGNHDRNSNTWYINHGWDCVVDLMMLHVFSKTVVLSHKPVPDGDYDFNIYGHFHNNDQSKCEHGLVNNLTKKHILLKVEHTYTPWTLRSIVEGGVRCK